MNWQQRYHFRQFVKVSLWHGPVVAMTRCVSRELHCILKGCQNRFLSLASLRDADFGTRPSGGLRDAPTTGYFLRSLRDQRTTTPHNHSSNSRATSRAAIFEWKSHRP